MGGFHEMQVERVLRESHEYGDLVVLARLPGAPTAGSSNQNEDEHRAVVVFKSHETLLQLRHVASILRPSTVLDPLSHNDVYFFFTANVDGLGPVWTKCVHPAPEKEIQYWLSQEQRAVRETPEQYANIVLPYIRAIPPERNAWIENIFAKTSESDKTFFENEHFVLMNDAKWDGQNIRQLHCLAVVRRKDLYTMRDLRKEDVPLLRNIIDAGAEAIESTYHLKRDQLKIFVHHLPSFFHLHIHFCSIYADPRQSQATRAHLVEDIIEALERDTDHFAAKASITYILGENHPLYKALSK